jgi:uncharacterized protein
VARSGYRPWQVVAYTNDSGSSSVPLLRDRAPRGGSTAYVCHGFACRLPVTTPDALRAQLRQAAEATPTAPISPIAPAV